MKMKKLTVRYMVASCAFGLVPIVANAQVQIGEKLTGQSAAKQNQPGDDGTPAGVQTPRPGQVVPQQPGVPVQPGRTNQIQRQVVPGQAGQTIQVTPGQQNQTGDVNQNQSRPLEKLIVKQLTITNQAEIELSQMAVDKAKSDEVKQFAQMLIEDHRQLNQKLSQLGKGNAGNQQGDAKSRPAVDAALPSPSQPGLNPPASADVAAVARDDSSSSVGNEPLISRLTSIAEKATKNHTEMVKEDLQNREGNEFDMAFVGYQIACHSAGVAKLQAMDGVGSPQLQSVLKGAEQRMTTHLDKAKQLAEKLKNGKQSE
jgi:predicted outer membrane protein